MLAKYLLPTETDLTNPENPIADPPDRLGSFLSIFGLNNLR